MPTTPRILLVEHTDSAGSSTHDLRARMQVLRHLGAEVRTLALVEDLDHDLQHGLPERAPSGVAVADAADASREVTRAALAVRADAVVWASAAPGGGAAARGLSLRCPAWWWPTGWSTETTLGPLRPLVSGVGPGDLVAVESERTRGSRLSLWDGPYALVATPIAPCEAEELFAAFARSAEGRDELDLVVLDDAHEPIEDAARAAGVGLRVHFVGRATREAETAWLCNARTLVVSVSEPLAASLVVRALAVGVLVLPVGEAAAPVERFLRERGATWWPAGESALEAGAFEAVIARTQAVESARARGMVHAAGCAPAALAAWLAGSWALPVAGGMGRAA